MSYLLSVMILCMFLCGGCSHGGSAKEGVSAGASAMNGPTDLKPNRMLIWRASLEMEVADANDAMIKAAAIAEKSGGYIEWKSGNSEKTATARLRIPVKEFKGTIALLEGLGSVTARSISGDDVTEKYIDIDARLKNKYALRERLKQLLDKAKDVKDILAIETELNRVQGDIDSMEATISSLKGKIDFATVDISFKRDQILGPLGYAFSGIWWCVKKLFVLRD